MTSVQLQDMVTVVSCIQTCAFVTWVADIPYSSRLGVDLSLLLTTVAFKLSTSGSLPVLPYLTIIGSHFLVCFSVLFSLISVHALESRF